MPKYRKKPVEIEALHYDEYVARMGWNQEVSDAHPWLDEAYDNGTLSNIGIKADGVVECRYIEIKTLEGNMRASVGDFIIRGVKGELYPCKPDIFAALYDPVT